MEAILFLGGNNPSPQIIKPFLDRIPFVAAADSGYDTALSLGVRPNLVVGDMDSLADESLLSGLPEGTVLRAPTDKDETDTELALNILEQRGYDRVVMVGGGGGRMDHFIALLMLYERDFYPAVWLTDSCRIDAVCGEYEFDCAPGSIVSVFPVGNGTVTVSSKGLKWKLDGLAWKRGDSGVSNVAMESRVKLSVHTGRVIVVRSF